LESHKFFSEYFREMHAAVETGNCDQLVECVKFIRRCEAERGKVIVVGNGGSAAMASHVSVDFTKAAQLRSINFNEAGLITCFANDYGHENWVAKALEAYADPQDLVILISSSGQSMNLINGAKQCESMTIPLITLSGFKPDNPLRGLGNINLWVNSHSYNVVEMTHHIWLLSLIDFIIAEKE